MGHVQAEIEFFAYIFLAVDFTAIGFDTKPVVLVIIFKMITHWAL